MCFNSPVHCYTDSCHTQCGHNIVIIFTWHLMSCNNLRFRVMHGFQHTWVQQVCCHQVSAKLDNDYFIFIIIHYHTLFQSGVFLEGNIKNIQDKTFRTVFSKEQDLRTQPSILFRNYFNVNKSIFSRVMSASVFSSLNDVKIQNAFPAIFVSKSGTTV